MQEKNRPTTGWLPVAFGWAGNGIPGLYNKVNNFIGDPGKKRTRFSPEENMSGKIYFNPGCALSIYKPGMEQRIFDFLNRHFQETVMHKICCRHEPRLEKGYLIINVCAGCDRRLSSLYEGISTISVWEIIDGLDSFAYPDYRGIQMSVQDACPVREKPQVHQAVRSLLKKMNIKIVETRLNGTHSVCCGDDLYPNLPVVKIHRHMKKRADSMPCEEVCVFTAFPASNPCISAARRQGT